MTYANGDGGRVDCGASDALPADDEFWSHAAVLERLVEAMQLWRRSHDIEARFGIGGRISSLWRMALEDKSLIDRHFEADAAPRPLPLGRADIRRMTEASEWIAFVRERDRRLVMIALRQLAGGRKNVGWMELWKTLGRGKPGPDGLRWRFDQAVQQIAAALNRGKSA